MATGHSRYHQNLASGQYPPAVVRLESLHAVLMGTHGIRYAMGHEVGHCREDRFFLIRHRLQRKSVPMWWRVVDP
jgi:hypothetical protein